MRTSRAAVNRVLDENDDTALTLDTLSRAAVTVGRTLQLELVTDNSTSHTLPYA